jgi:hypothetical protein
VSVKCRESSSSPVTTTAGVVIVEKSMIPKTGSMSPPMVR